MRKGVLASSQLFLSGLSNPSSDTPTAAAISNPSQLRVGEGYSATYTYTQPTLALEANEPPYAEDLVITGTLLVGNNLTATIDTLVIPNGLTAGTHIYRWYRASNKKQGFEELIVGATTNAYTLLEADNSKYIRAEVTLIQTGVFNPVGEIVKSLYTDRISSNTFNPLFDVEWTSAYVKGDLTNFNSSLIWINNKTTGTAGDIIQDSTSATPAYDPALQALRFESVNSEKMLIPKDFDTYPIELWFRFRLATHTAATNALIGFNNTCSVRVTNTGFFAISGATLTTGVTDNVWYTARIMYNGVSSTLELNNSGTPETFTASSTTLGGSGNGRIGCSASSTAFLDGWISHIFVSRTPLDSPTQDDMWSYFGL